MEVEQTNCTELWRLQGRPSAGWDPGVRQNHTPQIPRLYGRPKVVCRDGGTTCCKQVHITRARASAYRDQDLAFRRQRW